MIIKHGDLFTTDTTCIGHGVNTVGVMGAGIAKGFKDKFPGNYSTYRRSCQTGLLRPGGVRVVPEGDLIIFNFASQNKPGADARYDWLFDACLKGAWLAKENGYNRIAIPQIGCGIGGLEWDKVKHLLESIEILVPGFEWEVWIYA